MFQLHLPRYSNAAVLKERLLTAVQNAGQRSDDADGAAASTSGEYLDLADGIGPAEGTGTTACLLKLPDEDGGHAESLADFCERARVDVTQVTRRLEVDEMSQLLALDVEAVRAGLSEPLAGSVTSGKKAQQARENYQTMTTEQLKKTCADSWLDDDGSSSEMVERLVAYDAATNGWAAGGGMEAPPTAQELGRALRTVISAGVPLWNSGDFAGCAREYKRVCSQYMHADAGLAKAVSDCEGQSTGSAQDSQGWILRRAMDKCLEKIRAGTWEPTTPPLKVVLLCADFADHRADVQKHLARGLGVSTVPTMDLHEGVPSSVTLSHYDVAVVFTASWGAGMMRGYPSTTYDRNAVGDRLADFVDGGGSVVMMVRVCPVPSVACVHQ